MTILEYYIGKQKDLSWYKSYISVAKNGKGKLFSFINTNFRKLSSIFTQLQAFEPKDGKKRSEWNTMNCGQEEDKHRVVNLRNFGLITVKEDRYFITEKGKEVIRINESKELTEKDKWILLLMLIINYGNEDRSFDIVKTVLNLVESLSKSSIDRAIFLTILRKASFLENKNELIQTDAFWLITFFTDKQFIDLYWNSTDSDKTELFNWVISCMKDSRKQDDCLAYKYRNGGPYTVSTLKEDINISLCVLVIIAIQDASWENYLKLVCKFYKTADYGRISNFIGTNKEMYDKIYKDTFGNCFN